jgi:hypothetical protein
MNREKMEADYGKTREVILSCKNMEQLKVGVRMFNQLNKLHDIPEKDLNKLENVIGLMRMKCNGDEVSEGMSNIGKEFRKYAGQAGLNNIVFSEEEKFKGGEADNMSPEDLAKKHDVDVKDIKKEIVVGTKIEMEHTDSKSEAKEIAMDHIAEFSDYYSNDEFGIIAIEKSRGDGRKTIRVSKSDMEKLHKDGKLDIEGITLSYPEDMDEATSAGSSGSYVGLFSGGKQQPIRRTFDDVPVTKNGVVGKRQTGLPIGKLYSFNEDAEKNAKKRKKDNYEEEELDEATTVGGVGGVYDTPGFAPSKFMGTAGKKGKAPVKKKQPNDVLKNLGYQKVRVKDKCKKFPYCNQSPEAIEFYNESRVIKTIKKNNLKIKK